MPRRQLRAFTLIELIVVILILGILAAVAVLGFGQATERAHAAAAQTNLRSIANAVMAERTAEGAQSLTRVAFLHALEDTSVDVIDGLTAGDSTWTVYGHDHAPADASEFAVGFDYRTTDASDDNDNEGTRAVVVTATGDQSFARIIVLGASGNAGAGGSGDGSGSVEPGTGSDGSMGQVPNGTTPADVLRDATLLNTGGNGNGGSGPGEGAGESGYGEWVQPETFDYYLGQYGGTNAALNRTAVWNFDGGALNESAGMLSPAAVQMQSPSSSGSANSWIRAGNEYKVSSYDYPSLTFTTSGRLAVYQIGDSNSERPTDMSAAPGSDEWPEGVTGVELEGPGHYTGPTTVEIGGFVFDQREGTAIPEYPAPGFAAHGYILEGPNVPYLSPGQIAGAQPQVNNLASWTKRETFESEPGTIESWRSSAGGHFRFETDNWPISLMVASKSQVDGTMPITQEQLGESGKFTTVTEVQSLSAYAPYSPPRWRYVYGD